MLSKNKITKTVKQNIEYIVIGLLIIIFVYIISKNSFEHFYMSSYGFNRLDAIIYINLENRLDRKDLILNELNLLKINKDLIHKISGVYMPKNGHKGCIQSHILALQLIKLNKWNFALIFEDDAEINIKNINYNDIIEELLKKMDTLNWDVIMLATANKIIDNNFKSIPININNLTLNIEKIKKATTSSAYIIKLNYIDKILNLFNICNIKMKSTKLSSNNHEIWALDQQWEQLQNKDNWFALSTDLFKQREIWSTILNTSHTH